MRPAAGRQHARRPFHLSHALLLMAAFVVGNARPAVAQAPWTWAGYFELVASPGGPPDAPIAADGANRASRHPLSQDGRFVVFETDAPNLGAPAGASAIYRRDRISGVLTLVQAGFVRNAAISADGWHVAYEQCAPGFASPCQIYARDLRTAMSTPTLVSSTVPGVAGNGDSLTPTLSLNGRYAVYVTNAQNLSNDALRRKQIIWRDRDLNGDGIYDQVGAVGVQTITVNGAQFGNGDSDTPEVSDDGRLVAFRSAASNLVTGDTNALVDVFLRDRALSTTRRLNLRPGNVQSPFPIAEPHISMSGNGQFVAFASADPVLTSSVADSNATLDVFLYQGTTTLLRVDVGRNGSFAVPGNGPTGWATLNTDGRYLSLQSAATNAPFLSPTGTVQVYAVDRQFQTVTRISGMPDGAEPDAPSVQPSITAGGSLVTFSSSATTFTGMAAPAFAQIHAAARLNVTPETVTLPATGGQATIRISAHTYTRLQPWLDPDGAWLTTSLALNPPELNMLAVNAPQNDGAERSTIVHVGTRTVTVTQAATLSLTSVSPSAGPLAGGTLITIHGSGFVPGMAAYIASSWISTTFVDSSTLTAVTPHGYFGPVLFGVETPDQQSAAWLDGGFTYLDETPPVLLAIVNGPRGAGGWWFVGDVTVMWQAFDDESGITSTTCVDTVVTTDTAGLTLACSATSGGGTTTVSTTIARDTTPPVITVTSPRLRQLVEPGAILTGTFECVDALTIVTDCGMAAPSGAVLDTSTPGWHTFTVAARDALGHVGSVDVEYAVSSGVCTPLVPGTRVWLRFDGNRDDVMNFGAVYNNNQPDSYGPGVSGQAYRFSWNSLESQPYPRLNLGATMSAALWIRPESNAAATLLHHNSQFRLQREASGLLTWILLRGDGTTETGTSVAVAPVNAWTHVALTYDAGAVKLFVNGRIDGTWDVPLPILPSATSTTDRVRIGGPAASGTGTAIFIGSIDEVRLFDRTLTETDVEAIFLAGAATSCLPTPTTLTIPTITTTYGAGTYAVVATLTDVDGVPLAGKAVLLDQLAGDPYGLVFARTTAVTDAAGVARWDAPFDAAVGTYFNGVRGYFPGDHQHAHSAFAVGRVFINPASSTVTWTTPGPISYGTPLTSAQLNATADKPGTFYYTPSANTVPGAGQVTLSTTFWPTDTNYSTRTATVTLEVRKAAPTMVLTDTTVTYTGQPRPVTAAARDYRGLALSPVTVTYDGASVAPSAVGVYTVVASFPGDANHESGTATATLTIARATPTITFSTPVSFTFDGQPHGVAATVTGVGGAVLGTVPVTYGMAGAPVDAGTYVASATFDGNDTYTARTATTTVTITKALPSMVFAPQPPTFTYDGQPHAITATVTGVGGASLATPAVTYNGSAAAPVNAGTYFAAASFAGDANYVAISPGVYITIQKATPSIVFAPEPASFTYDGQPHALIATAIGVGGATLGAVPVTYPSSGSAPVSAGSWTASASFAGNANYTSHTATTPLTIAGAVPVVTIAGGPFVYNGQFHPATITVTGIGGQTLPVTASVTYGGSMTPPFSAGTYTVVASVAASGNYAATSATGTIVVEPAAATLTWPTPTAITYGTPLSWRQLNALANVPGSYAYVQADGTVLDVGSHTLTATFTSSDPNYRGATVSTTITVERATPSIGIVGEFFNYDGQPHPATLVGVYGVGGVALTPVNLTYDGAQAPPVNAGAYTVTATFDGDARHLPATRTATLTIHKAWPVVTWHPQVSATYGTPLGAAHLNATADVPGSFTYAPAAGTVLDASAPEAHTLRATFTPVDSQNYDTRTWSAPLWVYRASSTVHATGGFLAYDGQPHAGSGSATGVGGVVLGPVTLTYNDSPEAPIAPGAYTVRASFAGDTNHSAGTASATLTITRAPATVTVTGGTFAYDGQPHAATAAATGVGGVALSPVTVTYAGSSTVPVGAGTYAVVATFAGDANHTPATGSATITIGKATPVLSWAPPEPLPYGPTLGATQLNAQASVPGTFSYSPGQASRLPAGTHTLSATFTPADATNYAGGTVTTSITIVPAPLEIRTNDATKAYGSSLNMFSASFTGLASGQTVAHLSGTLVFATAATASSPVGTYAVTPGGLSSTNYAITFVSGTLTITKAPVTVTLVASPTPSGLDMPITFTATVSFTQGPPMAPPGTVRFFDGATPLGTATLTQGIATLLTGGLTAGSHTIEARYDGDASFGAGTRTATHVVTTAAATPAITLTTSRQPASTSQSMTFTATITVATAGSIAFYDGGTLLGSSSIASGQATLTVASLSAGSHAITARFQGTASAPPAISPVLVQSITSGGWKDRTTTLTLASSANPSALGDAVTFTATASGSSGTPTGRILFLIDGLVVGDPAGVAIASGQASVSVSTFAGGRHTVTATYLGNSNYRGSNGALTQTVN